MFSFQFTSALRCTASLSYSIGSETSDDKGIGFVLHHGAPPLAAAYGWAVLEQPISSAEVPEAHTMAADTKIRIAIIYAMVKVVDAGLVENWSWTCSHSYGTGSYRKPTSVGGHSWW
ncbi:hypothetical protein NA56DRAFT_711069 [Hyaloscypha hepaticicola]|uniref:Uncharacterized protein n=1 Tax=Hyaloscypha hepaticicola TaxID=2082293 RepID=A0A2J6PJS3_9HELO|nr:hypothetical protein NA56DRAFT_711069 [Hyaloscypha hepaticicola]